MVAIAARVDSTVAAASAFFVFGLVCLAFGATFFASPDVAAMQRSAYLANLAVYDSVDIHALNQTTADFDGSVLMEHSIQLVDHYGANSRLLPQDAPSHYLSLSAVDWTVNHTIRLAWNGTDTVVPALAPPNESIASVMIACSNNKGCSAATMRVACIRAACAEGLLFGGPGPADNGDTRPCYFTSHTPYHCLVIELVEVESDRGERSTKWDLSDRYRSCDWPFTGQRRTCGVAQPTIPYLLRTAHDPYVIVSDLTKGKFDFGTSRTRLVVIGAVLLAVGGLCWLAGISAVGFAVREHYKRGVLAGEGTTRPSDFSGTVNLPRSGGGDLGDVIPDEIRLEQHITWLTADPVAGDVEKQGAGD